jgi:hypothetical protein
MRKSLGFLILASILLSACNLPINEQSSTGDSIATRVASTLTAELNGENNPLGTSVAATLTSMPTDEISAHSSTPQPSETPAATNTVPPTETPTPSVTPTLNLGSPSWRNTLDNGVAFGLQTPYEDVNSAFSVANGVLVMKSFSSSGFRGWRLTSQSPANIYLQAILTTRSCSGQDQYGLVLRAPDYTEGQGYYLGLTCDSQFRFTRWDANGVNSLASGSNAAILGGTNQTNRLAIRAEGTNFKIYVNDQLIQEVNDSSFTGKGHFGVFTAGVSRNLVVDMDEIAYWTLP